MGRLAILYRLMILIWKKGRGKAVTSKIPFKNKKSRAVSDPAS
jgi:hypothetical protein